MSARRVCAQLAERKETRNNESAQVEANSAAQASRMSPALPLQRRPARALRQAVLAASVLTTSSRSSSRLCSLASSGSSLSSGGERASPSARPLAERRSPSKGSTHGQRAFVGGGGGGVARARQAY